MGPLLEGVMRELQKRPTTSSSINITGGGALTLIGITAIVVAISAVLVVAAIRQADMRDIERQAKEVQSLRDEVHKLKLQSDTHQIWLQTLDRRTPKEK